MNQLRIIRCSVFEVTQTEFAAIAGVSQSLVSKWERGSHEPGWSALQRIRAEALRRGLKWSDSWFFGEQAA